MTEDEKTEVAPPSNFIRDIIDADLAAGKHQAIVTRFPPEPNGYLHIGHAKAICLNYGLAKSYNGIFNLRFDDTNPAKEDQEYVDAIMDDVRWLTGAADFPVYYASDVFDVMHHTAIRLIEKGLAFVCDLTPEEMRDYRGTLREPGKPSPYRDRSITENLDLFNRMSQGEFPDGSKTLRAKIDMADPNIVMRDPVIYRILHAEHHRQGNRWCVYPMYDFAHPIEDAVEKITHSICTLEFEIHRPLYDWVIEHGDLPAQPHQYEFARLNLPYTVMSKRKLIQLVQEKHVEGWDDPRMPTVCGLRRRGYTPEAIRTFCEKIGVTKYNSVSDIALLEHCLRDDLNKKACRMMAVMNPLKVVITNFPEDKTDWLDAVNNPENPDDGVRKVPFTREIFIERDDFMENPPKKYFRLAPGQEVRLRYAYIIRCDEVIKDESGNVTELRCSCDLDSRGGNAPDGRKIKGTIHWVSATLALPLKVRLYDRLFADENPGAYDGNYLDLLNPDSLTEVTAWCEPALRDAQPGIPYQFERIAYFCADSRDSQPGNPVFNRTVTLKDSWKPPHTSCV